MQWLDNKYICINACTNYCVIINYVFDINACRPITNIFK